MKNLQEGMLLRIFVGESDLWEGKPLYEEIVLLARKKGLSGATVLKGFMGFGRHSLIHTSKLLRLSEDLPVVIEIVETEEKINQFLPFVDAMVKESLVTLEKATIILYRAPIGT